jgi:predicted dehydrogenase
MVGHLFRVTRFLAFGWMAVLAGAAADLRIGILGLDTPHCVYFSKILNDPAHVEHVPGAKIVAGYKGGSADIENSMAKADQFARELVPLNVKIYATVEEVGKEVDAIIIGSIDGRPHLEFVRRVLPFRKPLFVDKPLGGTLRDSIEIFQLARAAGVPCFSASSLRFIASKAALKSAALGEVRGAYSTGPGPIEPHHPDLFWYGIHAVESLYTVLGEGCTSVVRTHTPDADVVTGIWSGGRIGTVRVSRNSPSPYGVTVYGSKAVVSEKVARSYAPLVAAFVTFFKSGISPVAERETLELLAFMEAADESKRRGGAPVGIADVMKANGG